MGLGLGLGLGLEKIAREYHSTRLNMRRSRRPPCRTSPSRQSMRTWLGLGLGFGFRFGFRFRFRVRLGLGSG